MSTSHSIIFTECVRFRMNHHFCFPMWLTVRRETKATHQIGQNNCVRCAPCTVSADKNGKTLSSLPVTLYSMGKEIHIWIARNIQSLIASIQVCSTYAELQKIRTATTITEMGIKRQRPQCEKWSRTVSKLDWPKCASHKLAHGYINMIHGPESWWCGWLASVLTHLINCHVRVTRVSFIYNAGKKNGSKTQKRNKNSKLWLLTPGDEGAQALRTFDR